ncbi:hypothetical protein [Psychrobacter sp.]|uniref:hypothetical protein n=1 Tax=Psychrobacter sp. TaxID=56811 RepID=UPI0025E527A4|nr:hypothetical protein [Psychrobacter sp.]
MLNYTYDSKELTTLTSEARESLSINNPDADFTEFAAGVIYQRLKNDIMRYRVYGPYWWALKDVLRKYNYNVGPQTDESITAIYKGSNDAETIVAADLFYLEMSSKTLVTNNSWDLKANKEPYVLYDEDMETRRSITDMID